MSNVSSQNPCQLEFRALKNIKDALARDYYHPSLNTKSTRCSNESERDNTLKLLSWNINGLTQYKLYDNILGNFLKQYDVIMLCETWTSDQDNVMLEGFEFYNFPRLKKTL